MKKKPTSFWGSVRRYAWIALLLGWIPNLGIVILSERTAYESGFVFSLISFSLIALFVLWDIREMDQHDKWVATFGTVMSCFSLLIMAVATFDTRNSLLYQGRPDSMHPGIAVSGFAEAVLMHRIVSNGLGFFFGLIILSLRYLISRPQEKRKVEDI
jgi:hypothetical protein